MSDDLTSDTMEALRALWALTPENLRGKLPKPYKKDAPKGSCNECGGYHGLPALHLDYLGHADTCRLIAEKDILWQWEPKGGWEENGEPRFVRDRSGYPIALWIDLTILGVTRPGVGTVTTGKGDPEKELIGDAIRNAAMRFGVGADMWSKAHHAEVLDGDDGPRTYDRNPQPQPPVDPEAWFAENGWRDRAHHDEVTKALRDRIAAAPDPVKVPFRAWFSDQGMPWAASWPKAFTTALESRLNDLSQNRDEAPGPTNPALDPETPLPAVPAPESGDPQPLPAPDERTTALIAYVEGLKPAEIGDQLKERNAALSGTMDIRRSRLCKLLLAEGWQPEGERPVSCSWCNVDFKPDDEIDHDMHTSCRQEWLAEEDNRTEAPPSLPL